MRLDGPRRRAPAVFCLTLLAAVGSLSAQEQGTLFVFSRPEAVLLRWNAPRQEPYGGFHVERRPGGGDWIRLTAEPVARVEDTHRIRELLGFRAESYLTFFGDVESIDDATFARVMSDPVARGMIDLLSVKLPELGRVLGELYRDTALIPGESFDYRVVLVAAGGAERVWATSSQPVTHGREDTVPVPQGLRGEAGDRQALLSWEHAPSLSRRGELVGYRVYRAEEPFGPFRPATVETVVPTAIDGELPEHLFVDRFLQNGLSYWYRVTGMNVAGAEGDPSQIIKVVPRDRQPPPPPKGLEGRPLGQAVVLRWSAVEDDDLAGYAIYRAREFEGPYHRLVPVAGELPSPANVYVDSDVGEGGIYWYRVTALDDAGNESRAGETVQVFLEDRTPPVAPQGLQATPSSEGIVLTWEANREADLAGYLVERTTRLDTSGDEIQAEGPFFVLHAEPLREIRYLDPVPETSQSRYAYRIVAIDKSWNRSPASEAVVARMPDRVPPSPPALHSARLEKGAVVLRWGRSSEEDLAGYRLYRATGEKGSFEEVHRELLPTDAGQYEDHPGEAGRRYRYRLTAVDRAGNESESLPPVTVHFLDLVPPDPPTDLTLESLDSALRLAWKPSPSADAAAVLVYRRAGSAGRLALRVRLDARARGYDDTEVEAGTEYTYILRALDAAANASDPTPPVTAVFDPPEAETQRP